MKPLELAASEAGLSEAALAEQDEPLESPEPEDDEGALVRSGVFDGVFMVFLGFCLWFFIGFSMAPRVFLGPS